MKQLNINDWISMNDLIYKIHSCTDIKKLQEVFLNGVQILVPFDKATFYLSEDFSLNSSPTCFNTPPEVLNIYIDNMEKDYTKWMFSLSQSMACRESDYWSDEERETTDYYKILYAPLGIHYAAIMTLVHQEVFVASCNFYNSKVKGDFSDKSMAILNCLKNHLSLAVYKLLKTSSKIIETAHIEQFAKRYRLTNKEIEIFKCILRINSTDAICKELFISPHTLKNHLQNIYNKVGVRSKLELILKAENLK